MPTEVIIAPSAGKAPFPAQGISNYDAVDFRRFYSRAYVEGVTTAGAWKVTATGTPNMQVQVAADDAAALVQGDSVADQGIYYVAPHAAALALDVTPAHATLPRIDRVVIHVRDHAHDGSGANDAKVKVLPGTATAGATVENEAGAAAVPSTAMLLAQVVVPAAATTIPNANIRDMRPYALRDATVGEVVFSAASAADVGWVECHGQALSRKQHARLFAKLGTTYGVGDGSTTFNVPDLRGRVPVGVGQGAGLTNRTANAKGGAESVQLGMTHMPSPDAADSGAYPPGFLVLGGSPYTLGSTGAPAYAASIIPGGGQAHENMPPFIALRAFVFSGSVAT